MGIKTQVADLFTCEALFATMTNVNFQEQRFVEYIRKAIVLREDLKTQVQQACNISENWSELAGFVPDFDSSLVEQGQDLSFKFISHRLLRRKTNELP